MAEQVDPEKIPVERRVAPVANDPARVVEERQAPNDDVGRGPVNRVFKRIEGDHACFGGVCAGMAYWLGAPTWIVRLVCALALWFNVSIVFVIYIILWIFAPEWKTVPEDYEQVTGED